MSKTHKPRESVWAVVRVDEFHDDSTAWHDRIIVKEVVRSKELALSEVRRLNDLDVDKSSVYFATMTRLFPNDTSAGS